MNKTDLKIGPYYFEQLEDFKYLGFDNNSKNNINNEIKLRINAANRAYFAMKKMFSSG